MAIETLQYVYQLSDFETTGGNIAPPDEQGAQASGSPPFNLQLATGAEPLQVVVNDAGNDGFDEISSNNQTLDVAVTIDGVLYPAGSRVLVNYSLTTADGFRVYSITIGSGNSGNNTTTALISEAPLVPGQQYVFTQEGNIGNGEVPYADLACFGAGTLIETETGLQAVETLQAGDLVRTADRGLCALRAVLSTQILAAGENAPIVFADGAMGNAGTLVLSPNHRVVIRGARVELLTGVEEALVAAKHLVNGGSIRQRTGGMITYYHLVFERHEIVFSNGIASESYFPASDIGADRMGRDPQAAEFHRLFPGYETRGAQFARPAVRRHEARAILKTLGIVA